MGKISTYPKDTNVTGLDILLGSDANTPGKITKNFSTNALASYFNKSAIIDTGQFSWEFLPYNNTQAQPEKTFMKVDWLNDTININNLAGVLRVSALTLGNTQPGAFIQNEWVGNNILVHLPNAPSAYSLYTVDSLVPDGDWYYLMTISFVGGESFVIQKNDPVVMGYFAGANVITEITGTFPILVSEGSIPDVSIDETKLGEWDLAFNETITSASVTGTTTKTLTLTQQDGGTITASWTDEDTNLVTSVFGRIGAVIAVSGDYNTDLVTEATNLYFTQARAIASPITGYNPAAGTITASDTILTAINKLSGNISGGYVPYTGATNNVNLGEKGITAGYVGFDLTPTATPTSVGTMYWDSAYRTVSLIDGDGDTTLQIGQEERILVHNGTGSPLTDGQVVYVTGSTGNLPSVSLADASSETTSAATLGVVTESIVNGADGFITVSGMVNGLNTLAFAEGDLLWLSETAGQFTNVKPIAPAHLVLIGYVIKRAGGNGSILVKIQNTQELSESSDVLISAPEIDGQGLFLQTISGVQLWRNRSIPDVLGYTPADEATTITINGTTQDLSANRTWSVGTVTSIAVGLGTSGTDVNVSGSPITSSGTITLNIPSASATNRGLLTPTDWATFNNKQAAGNYITSLTGEATASGPGAAAVTLSTPAVTGKLLTGVNITGGTVVATDTILEAFGKVQNQINGLVGGSIYKGTWNAATNTPTITSGVGNTGWYYIVSVAGSTNIDGITDWNLGDWIIFDGTAWQQVDNTDAVVSVNGYTGAVSLVSSDVPEGLTNLYFTNARARGAVSLTTTGSSGAATYNSDSGVFNIPDYGSALSGYLPLSGGTLTGGLYINPQNTSTVGLDVASNTVTLRSDNLEGFKRQLTTTMGSGTLIKIQAAGYGGTYVTDLGFYTSSSSAVNTTPNLYLTGGDNRVGINMTTPAYTLDVVGTAGVSGQLYLGSTITNGTYTYTLPGATGTLALASSLTGFISGSGTSNYVPKFTASQTIGNSSLKEMNTGWMQLGDSSVSNAELDLIGNSGANIFMYDGYGSVTIQTYYNDYFTILAQVGATTRDLIAYKYSTQTLSFWNSGSGAKMSIFSNGNTIIGGTVDAGYKLDVNGTANFAGNITGTNITISNSLIAKGGTFNGGALSGGVVTIDGLGSDLLMNRADTSNGASITLLTNAVEKWNIGLRSAGTTDNFFIYNSNLLANALTINSATSAATFASSATATNFILSGGTGNTGLYYGHTDRVVLANYTTGGIDFEVNGGSIVATLFPSGNYGLGIALDAGYKLDVNGTARISGALSGTSATFSSGLTIGTLASGSDAILSFANNASGSPRSITYRVATAAITIDNTSGSPLISVLNNGNLGIGLTNPQARFVLQSANNYETSTLGSATANTFTLLASNGLYGTTMGVGNSGNTWIQSQRVDANTATYNLLLNPNGGNVGIGTSSPANYTNYITQTINGTNGAIVQLQSSGTASLRLIGEGVDSYLDNVSTGALIFRTTSSSSERMRITSFGDVCVGNTSSFYASSGRGNVSINGSSSSILALGVAGSVKAYMYTDGASLGFEAVGTQYTSFATGSSERMRITSGGNVGIGTTSPASKLHIEGTGTGAWLTINRTDTGSNIVDFTQSSTRLGYIGYIGNDLNINNATASNLVFRTSDTERMRITSGGNVLIGTTSDGGYKLDVNGKTRVNSSDGFFIQSGSQYRQMYFDGFSTLYFWNGSNQANLSSAGAWVNASDATIKKDITAIKYGLSDLMLLNPCSYKMKTDDLEQIGFIAQEVEQIIPEVVNSDNKGMKGLSYGNMVALLTKSIQELKAELDKISGKV